MVTYQWTSTDISQNNQKILSMLRLKIWQLKDTKILAEFQ